MIEQNKNWGLKSFIPLLTFLAVYLGAGVVFSLMGTENPFKQISREFAVLCGLTTVILLILIIGGFIMLSLGVIGHYIARIYEEVKGRPKYIISHVTENVPGTAVGSWKREHRES